MQINQRKKVSGQAHRSKTDPYYQSSTHRNLRKAAFERDGGQCCSCGLILNLHSKKGSTKFQAVADHTIPRRAGGTDTLDNIQTLCKSCHDKKSIKDKEYYK